MKTKSNVMTKAFNLLVLIHMHTLRYSLMIHFIPEHRSCLFSLMFENALFCAVAVCNNYDLCVFVFVDTFLSVVQPVFKEFYLSVF